jgi:hypothetical protein
VKLNGGVGDVDERYEGLEVLSGSFRGRRREDVDGKR